METLPPNFIVGLGGSAGSLKSFKEFLDALPPDTGMAFVFVSHIYPEANSQLRQILSRRTKMPTIMVTEDTEVAANTVYVIAPDTDLYTNGNMLVVSSPTTRNEQVDIFFTSLAESQGRHAIGIIFSGYDGDGALGCERIKANGGVTFAQDGAEVTHMPHEARLHGFIDFVMLPKDIPAALKKISEKTIKKIVRLP